MRTGSFMSSVFRKDTVPQLLYISRQEHGISRPLHSHDRICELTLVLQGGGVFRLNDTKYPIQAGDILVNNAGEEHEMLSENNTLEAYCLGYTDVYFRNYPDNYLSAPQKPAVRHAGRKFQFLADLAEQILDLDPQDDSDQVLIQSLALSLLLTADAVPFDDAAPVITGSATELTSRIKTYISLHYTEDVTLEDISRELSFSTDYLSHTFKKATGYSIKEYIIRRRIGYAETLLISSNFSVTHIATLVGYDNPSHFQNAFKKVAGIPPLQYRNRYLKILHGRRDQQ